MWHERGTCRSSAGAGLLVEVYTVASCLQCRMTRRRLEAAGVGFVELPAEAHLDLLLTYGITTAPGVIVRAPGTDRVPAAWGGFRPDLITEHITTVLEETPDE